MEDVILYEHEGKALLRQVGLSVPCGQLLNPTSPPPNWTGPLVLKAQTLSGKRAAEEGITVVRQPTELLTAIERMFGRQINGARVETILAEDLDTHQTAYYLSLSYSTDPRGLVLSWSMTGGAGIEERGAHSVILDPLAPRIPQIETLPRALALTLVELFLREDCLLLEINPLVLGRGLDEREDWYALDAKIKLDDTAAARHPNRSFSPRVGYPAATARERAAKEIDAADYRGVAGSTYFDLPGDIAILASGGGASLLALDSLATAGGAPANYTEYSGNPSRGKVERLTEIVLDKVGLNGLWVVGAVANFTDIFETLSGVLAGLRRVRTNCHRPLDFPIVVRRGGPRVNEALTLLRSAADFDFHLFGPEVSISESAEEMTALAAAYRKRKHQ